MRPLNKHVSGEREEGQATPDASQPEGGERERERPVPGPGRVISEYHSFFGVRSAFFVAVTLH